MSKNTLLGSVVMAGASAAGSLIVSAVVRKHKSFTPVKRLAQEISAQGQIKDPKGEYAPQHMVRSDSLLRFLEAGGDIAELVKEVRSIMELDSLGKNVVLIPLSELPDFAQTEVSARKLAPPVDAAASDEAEAIKALEKMLLELS